MSNPRRIPFIDDESADSTDSTDSNMVPPVPCNTPETSDAKSSLSSPDLSRALGILFKEQESKNAEKQQAEPEQSGKGSSVSFKI